MQVTSIEQSKRLVELGISPNTADMTYIAGELRKGYAPVDRDDYIPTWSLSRLLELMPISYQMTRDRNGKVQLMLITVPRKEYFKNELEAAYSMICWLLENDLFDAEKMKNYVPTTHCCFCGKEIKPKEAHNAQPVKNGVCCITCNNNIVVPERMKLANYYGTQH